MTVSCSTACKLWCMPMQLQHCQTPAAMTFFVVAAAAVIEQNTCNDSHTPEVATTASQVAQLRKLQISAAMCVAESNDLQQHAERLHVTTALCCSRFQCTVPHSAQCSLHKQDTSNAATGCQPSSKRATYVRLSACKQHLCPETATVGQKRSYLRLSQTAKAQPGQVCKVC